jgi:hypothetical protein
MRIAFYIILFMFFNIICFQSYKPPLLPKAGRPIVPFLCVVEDVFRAFSVLFRVRADGGGVVHACDVVLSLFGIGIWC